MTASPMPADHAKRADIQGMRAVAVLAVVFYHARHALVPGGFTGVDVFFVLSGYLITQVLLRPMDNGRFSILDFYRRRVRRLYPALFTMMAFTLAVALVIFPPTMLRELVNTQFFTTLFVSNFVFERNTGYFDIAAEMKPLLHTWSLGVEEQFYVLFPPILYALHRWARKWMWAGLLVMALASLAFSQGKITNSPDVAFFIPTSRAFELLIGALCVGLKRHTNPPLWLQNALGIAGLAAILVSFVVVNDTTPFPGINALLPCLGAAALLQSPQGVAGRGLSWAPLEWIGNLSYSLYLWHWPLLVFARFLFPDSDWALAGAVVLALGAAWLSYRYVEQPFLRGPGPMWKIAAVCMVPTMALCLPIYYLNGLPQRFSAQERSYLDASNDFNPDRKKCHMASDRPKTYAQDCVYGAPGVKPSVAVWSDSMGAELTRELGTRLTAKGMSLRAITMSGCPATLNHGNTCSKHTLDMMAAIKADPDMHTVVLLAHVEGSDVTYQGVEHSALELQQAGKQVILVFPIPTFDYDPPSRLALFVRGGGNPDTLGMARAEYERRHSLILADFEKFTQANHIAAVRPEPIFCDATLCHVYRTGLGVLYFNAGHLSLKGASLLADQVLPQIAAPAPASAAKH